MSRREATVGFPLGYLYSRFTRGKPAGSVDDVENYWLDKDAARSRGGTDLRFTNPLSTTRLLRIERCAFSNGACAYVGLSERGRSWRFESAATAASAVDSTLTAGSAFLGSVVKRRDAVFSTNGSGLPHKYLPLAASGYRDMYAGCPAPLMHATDDAITCAVAYPGGEGGGLEEGHRYWGISILYGPNGEWGESAIGALGHCVVPGGQTGVVTLTIPILGSASIPDDLFYAGAWGRAIYRIVANDDRNGPYYQRDIIPDMTTTTWVDAVPDAAIDGAVKTLFDDPMIPPRARLACWNVNRMLYGGTATEPRRVWASEINYPDLVRGNFAEDMQGGEALTALFSRGGIAYGLTATSFSEGYISDSMSWQHMETEYGCLAPYSLGKGPEAHYWLSSAGPVMFRGGAPEPLLGLGGRETWNRIWRDLLDHASNLEQCVGLMVGGRYVLAYPDMRDNCYAYTGSALPALGFGTTRAVAYDPAQGNWTKLGGIFLGAAATDGDHVIFADSRTYANILTFTDDHYDYDVNLAAEHAMRRRLVLGNLANGDTGHGSIPTSCAVVAEVQGSASVPVYVRAILDGTRASEKKIYAGAGDFTPAVVATSTIRRRPEAFPVPVPPEICRELQIEITNEATDGTVRDVGDITIYGIEAEMQDVR